MNEINRMIIKIAMLSGEIQLIDPRKEIINLEWQNSCF